MLIFGVTVGGNKMNIQPKDTSKGHFIISMFKSILRIGAGLFLFLHSLEVSAVLFIIAELLGVAEELV